ncbi:hypothetical protein Q070_03044 [Pseudomonas aeruginosa BL16]|nr:hypothetical protein CIA_01301 [Pseudomonas aeruginosa PA14]ERV30067.1 hypothetical protein Q070_03044 [Pseudomonas aeruginosa BL16]ERV88201.1 hypothetical protein Q040_03155 [Pseudomonas aeruginosa BWHPSA027]ETV15189.1 hypothetical protein Q049_03510 [Pseudomonas aeruginosa BWHPSA044]EZO58383.1 hypothetical protein V559_05154 [Pseudomonas aeruginosa BWH058]WBI44760.1 hypothetical protein PALA26_03923 [Pseudomonas aeruginosa]
MDQVEDVANLMHASERHLPIKLSAGSGRRDGPKEYDAALPRNLREHVDGLILGGAEAQVKHESENARGRLIAMCEQQPDVLHRKLRGVAKNLCQRLMQT